MRILHIGYALEKASGVTTFVENVASKQRLAGHEVDIVDAAKTGDSDEALGVFDKIAKYDIVHLHCLWQLHKYAKAARGAGVPIVWSTHGMTAPWAMRYKWLKKKIAWWMFQKRDLCQAAAIHCTTEQEAEWNRRLGPGKCFVAPLGTDEIFNRVEHVERVERVLLLVGRVHPVKGLENLIRAWGIVKLWNCGNTKLCKCGNGASGECPAANWKLRIVGPDEGGHLESLKLRVESLKLGDSVEFAGSKYGEDLSREYEECDCLVLPSFTENFGATVVDAMAHGKPVITSTFTPWREVKEHGCGWWVPNTPESLATAIGEMIGMGDDERVAMGAKGRELVAEKYSWTAVADKVLSVYRSVVKGEDS